MSTVFTCSCLSDRAKKQSLRQRTHIAKVFFRYWLCFNSLKSLVFGGITWPIGGDAGLVFRSARFATYFTILSVKFEPLCIRPIMSAKADKGDRKREIEQSPMKKKFRDSAISSEDLDSAIASRIELAFKEHQSTLNSVVNSAVRDAMDSVLIPALRELREDILATNKSVKELREEFEAIVTKTKQTRDRVDSVQAAAREDKRTVTDLKDQLERLTRRWQIWRTGADGTMLDWWDSQKGWKVQMQLVFLRANLSKWIPSLRAVTLRLIGRIACMTEGGAPIGRALSSSVYWDGMTDQISWKVLGRRIRWSAHRTMSHCCFFLTLVRLQRSGERHLVRFEEDDCTWSPALPHLSSGD